MKRFAFLAMTLVALDGACGGTVAGPSEPTDAERKDGSSTVGPGCGLPNSDPSDACAERNDSASFDGGQNDASTPADAGDSVDADGGDADAGTDVRSEHLAASGDASGDASDARSDGAPPDASDARSDGTPPDDAGTNPFICLPSGEEKLVVAITGNPSLTVATPDGATCLSRFHPATASELSMLDLIWSVTSPTVFVTVRMYQVVPGQTGTFNPFAVLIAEGSESWAGLGAKCRVAIASSTKIAESPQGPSLVREIYKVAGTMTCDSGWAQNKPNDELTKFEFATRVTFYRE